MEKNYNMNIPPIFETDSSFTKLWKSYVLWDEFSIHGFFGEDPGYRWLSNFHICPVYFEGDLYISSENAYQAAKFDRNMRQPFLNCKPSEAKRMGKSDTTDIEEWDNRKYDVMSVILFDKFYRNTDLRIKLLKTGGKHLEETNHWNDVCWGVDYQTRNGKNALGNILMDIRQFWTNKSI